MDLATLLVAISLAMDSFSVSIANGLARRKFEVRNALEIAAFFGAFQGAMLLVGWATGAHVIGFVAGFDHWIAFLLLLFIGCRMIYESLREKPVKLVGSLSLWVLLVLSVATSIDAFAVGLSLSFLEVDVLIPAAMTAIITFSLSFSGVYLGDKFGHLFKNRFETLGGLILIAIGIKVVVEHLGLV